MNREVGVVPTLQVRDLPEELYQKMLYLAEKEHRSLTQTTIVLLKEGLERHLADTERRRDLLRNFSGIGVETAGLPDAEILVREDRDRR
jgi:hypothetical protein